MSSQEIYDSGHTLIPLLSYVTEKQLAEQLEVLGASELDTVCVNMQVVEGEKAAYQRRNVEMMAHIARMTDWRVLAYGIARADVIEELSEIFGERLLIANSDPYFRAMRRHKGQRKHVFSDGIRRYLDLADPDQDEEQRQEVSHAEA